MVTPRKEKIVIVGSGIVGRYWAMLFVSQEHPVVLYDLTKSQLEAAMESIKEKLTDYEKKGYLKGSLSAAEQFELISTSQDLAECLKDCYYVQENVFENIDVKREVIAKIDNLMDDSTIIGSSSSTISMTKYTKEMKHRENMLVAHPVNPPYFVPLVELVPTPWTSSETIETTRSLMTKLGQAPVVQKDVPGFVFNRIQYVVLNECYNLIQSGAISTEDMETVIKDGLGMRYAFIGALETARLNAYGWLDYAKRYSKGILDVSSTFQPPPEFTQESATKIENDLAKSVPFDALEDRKNWRDDMLAKLLLLKQSSNSK